MQRGRRIAQTDAARAKMRLGRQRVEAKLAQAEAERRAQAIGAAGRPEEKIGCAACVDGRRWQCEGRPCGCLCCPAEELPR